METDTTDWELEYRKARTALKKARREAMRTQQTVRQAEEHYKKVELAFRVDQLNKAQGK